MKETYILETDRILTCNDVDKLNAAILNAAGRAIPLVRMRLSRVEYLKNEAISKRKAMAACQVRRRVAADSVHSESN